METILERVFGNPYAFMAIISLIVISVIISTKSSSARSILKQTLLENDVLYSKLEAKENTIKLLEKALEKSKAKPIVMYRRAITESEKNSGFDYFFIKSFKSHRAAEKETGLIRSKISKSLKNNIFVKHPKMIETYVVFAPYDNELNSNEKQA